MKVNNLIFSVLLQTMNICIFTKYKQNTYNLILKYEFLRPKKYDAVIHSWEIFYFKPFRFPFL